MRGKQTRSARSISLHMRDAFVFNVREHMAIQEISARKLSKRLGRSPSYVNNMLRWNERNLGRAVLTSTVANFADALGVNPLKLLRRPD